MGFTSAGLANGGQTAHYQIAYDETFSRADGLNRAAQLMDQCEFDFDLMNGWFGSPGFKYSFPIAVNIANATGGAIWSGGYQFPFSEAATVTINPGTGTSTAFIRYLLVTEVVEMFMDTIDNGWFQGSDEGSKGEGLSRFLGHEFLVARVGNVRFPLFELVPGWLNSPTRSLVGLNAIDTAPDDRQPDLTNGCTTCFVYFLRYQLGFSIEKIIQAGASTLAGVFKNLTGRTDASQSFFKVVNTFYPQGFLYNPAGDRLFPVANLATFDDFQIQANQTWQARILTLDTQALAEVNVTLVSDNPMLIQVPNLITFQPGTWNIGFNITAADVVGPAQTVQVHASYARKTLTSNVTITPRSSVLQGQVTDVASRPIADATVFITSDIPFWLGGDELQLSTDANGFYQTPTLPPHTYQVSASQSGYVTSQVSVSVGVGVPVTTKNFVLAVAQPITIKGVVSQDGGGAIAGARLTLDINSAVPGRLQTQTNAAGAYSFNLNPEGYGGDYTLTASTPGFAPTSYNFSVPNGATVTENFDLVLLGSLTGHVTDSGGHPIAGAIIAADDQSTRSAADGTYDLRDLPPSATLVTATARGFNALQENVMIASGAPTQEDFALVAASAVIRGTITDANEGLALVGATLRAISSGDDAYVTQSDNNGDYALESLPAGQYHITASHAHYKSETADVQVISHQIIQEDFALERPAKLGSPRGPLPQAAPK